MRGLVWWQAAAEDGLRGGFGCGGDFSESSKVRPSSIGWVPNAGSFGFCCDEGFAFFLFFVLVVFVLASTFPPFFFLPPFVCFRFGGGSPVPVAHEFPMLRLCCLFVCVCAGACSCYSAIAFPLLEMNLFQYYSSRLFVLCVCII